MKKIYYVGYYDTQDSTEKREYYLSATNLMDYLAESIDSSKYILEYVSMSGSVDKKMAKGSKHLVEDARYLKKFFSLGRGNSLFTRLDVHFLRLQMFLYLLFNVKRDDIVIVYHSLNYVKLLRDLKRVKKFNLISQICEIYRDVSNNIPKKLADHELDLVEVSDAFVFSNKHLQKLCNTDNKPSALLLERL